MAPNKFATMLHRNTNRITLVLVYAILEWTLIFFLLLNSLFSFLIIKFANYFGLKPPCLLCSRIGHILETQNSKSSYRDLICEQHAIELSRSGYCFNHRKLVESQDMCEDCLSSHQDNHQHPSLAPVFRWLKEIGIVKSGSDRKVVENSDMNLRCSCCGVTIKSDILSPCDVIKPSSGGFVDTQKAKGDELLHDIDLDEEPDQNRTVSLAIKGKDRDGIESSRDIQMGSDSDLTKEDDNSEGFSFWHSKGDYSLLEAEEDEGDVVLEAETEPLLRGSTASMKGSYADEMIPPLDLEFYIDVDDYQQLIPVASIKLEMEVGKGESQVDWEENQKFGDQEKATQLWRETEEGLILEPDIAVAPAALDVVEKLNSSSLDLLKLDETQIEDLPTKQGQDLERKREIDSRVEINETTPSKKGNKEEETKREVGDAVVLDADKFEIFPTMEGHAEPTRREIDSLFVHDQAHDVPLTTIEDQVAEEIEVTELDANIPTADCGDAYNIENGEIDAVNSVEPLDKNQVVEPSIPCKEECPSTENIICETSTSSTGLLQNGGYEPMQTEEMQNHNDIIVEIAEQDSKSDVALPYEPNEMEEGKTPDTPSSIDTNSLHHLHKEILLPWSMGSLDEDTLDGSAANELNSGDGAVIVEELKSVLKSERKTLRALYAELEEERNAAAIAANQTMAMINRLQEEKATIEMEALQYQRLMEEQSEYDQEALQLMNEILVKREKEMQELEKELEIYRKKVMDYEERERMRLLSRRQDRSCTRSRTSPASCSNGEDNDGSFVDWNNESREEDCSCGCVENGYHQNTPVGSILNLQESSSSFEEERISILEQLKVLEEKLCTLAEEEEHHIGNMKPFEQFYEENAKEFNRNFELVDDSNGLENGSSTINGKHHQERRMNGQKPKQLLPLFDAAELESGDEQSNGVEDGLDSLVMHKSPPKFELEKKRIAIEEEVDHVYERLHALEADREFIKHCIGSLKKGDRGVDILQEILQHLRDLKNVELQARNVYGVC